MDGRTDGYMVFSKFGQGSWVTTEKKKSHSKQGVKKYSLLNIALHPKLIVILNSLEMSKYQNPIQVCNAPAQYKLLHSG